MRRLLGYLIALVAWPAAAQVSPCYARQLVQTDSLRAETMRVSSTGATLAPRRAVVRRLAVRIDSIGRACSVSTVPPRDTLRPPRDTVRPPTPPADTTTPPPSFPPGVVVLPQVIPSTPADLRTRPCTITAGTDLQSAINAQAATPGASVLCLPAGMVYTGRYTVPVRADTGWRYIRASGAVVASRMTPTQAVGRAKVIGTGAQNEPALTVLGSRVALSGLEVTVDPAKPTGGPQNVVALGTAQEASAAGQPQYVVLDQLYIHGYPGQHCTRRGVLVSARDVVIHDSWIDEIHDCGFDSQGIGGWQGGPLLIENNFVAAASETIMFGGANPSFTGGNIRDVTLRGNHITKRYEWAGKGLVPKNLLELKSVHRILIEGNVLERSWAEAQVGGGLLIVSSSQSSAVCKAWCQVKDVTVRGNIIRETGYPIGLSASQGSPIHPDSGTARVLIEGNLFEDVNRAPYAGEGKMMPLYNNPNNRLRDITIRGNTWSKGPGSVTTCIEFAGNNPVVERLTWTHNVCETGTYGPVRSSNAIADAAFALHAPGAMIGPNHYTGTTRTGYRLATWGAVVPSGIGVNVSALRARLASVVVAP